MRNPLNKKLTKIQLVIFDIDGIFTDGSVYVDAAGNELLRFSRIDGQGIQLIREAGLKTAVISSADAQASRKRMEKLKIDSIIIGVGTQDKLSHYQALRNQYGLRDEQIAYCGDDIMDIAVLQAAGLALCPANAQEPVKKICDFVSARTGAQNFVREICNLLLASR